MLKLREFFQSKQQHLGIEYNLNSIFSMLVFNRYLCPSSKKKAYETKHFFSDKFNFSLDDVYRSLNYFSKCSNEKCHVEGSIKIIRSELFGPVYKFESTEKARERLNHELIKLNEGSDIEAEKRLLLPYKPMLDLAEIRIVKINKYSFARIRNNNYSLPDYIVGKKVKLRYIIIILNFLVITILYVSTKK